MLLNKAIHFADKETLYIESIKDESLICLLSEKNSFVSQVYNAILDYGLEAQVIPSGSNGDVVKIFSKDVRVILVDPSFTLGNSRMGWAGILSGVSEHVKVYLLSDDFEREDIKSFSHVVCVGAWGIDKLIQDIVDTCLDENYDQNNTPVMPKYNKTLVHSILESRGKLGVIVINSNSLSDIKVQYGQDVYEQVQKVIYDLLQEMWGKQGWFRSEDLLFESTETENEYFVFLTAPRRKNLSLLITDGLERMADRMFGRIQEFFWKDFNCHQNRKLPKCIEELPKVQVGFSSVLFNPIFSVSENVKTLISNARNAADTLAKRALFQQREILHSLIHDSDVLEPHYQAIFKLDSQTVETVLSRSGEESMLDPLQGKILGFESLIRINQTAAKKVKKIDQHSKIDFSYFTPRMLFAFALQNKLTLELDQACMKLAVEAADNDLPGSLFINILPRNLYHLDQLIKQVFQSKLSNIVFELSETEAIRNFDLVLKVRETLQERNLKIAADDFGKGHCGFDRILKLNPDFLKLDFSLVHHVDKDKGRQELLRGIVKAAKARNCSVLAEGVENLSELRFLHSIGVHYVQGFLLHRPESKASVLSKIMKSSQSDDQESLEFVA